MLREFYYSLKNELGTLNVPVSFGISRGITSGTYITFEHVDSFDNMLTFGMIDNDCFYQKVQCQIKCHSDTSQLSALQLAEQVKDLLVYDFFQIDYFRIVDITFEQKMLLYEGKVDAFTYVITMTWLLGTSTQEMSSSSFSSSSMSSLSSMSSSSSSRSSNSLSSKSSVSSSSKSSLSSLSSNGAGCQLYWSYTYTCATGLYVLRSHAFCSDSASREDYGWIVYASVPGVSITWMSAEFFYDDNCE
jgi:hypothetical protein